MGSREGSTKNRREDLKQRHKCSRCGVLLDDGYTRINCPSCRNYINERNKIRRANDKKAIRKLKTGVTNNALYDAMQLKGITIKEVANHISMSDRSVQRWILEGVEPRYDHIKQSVNAFVGEEVFQVRC